MAEASNGDTIVKLEGGKVVAFGVLHSATTRDHCDGFVAPVQEIRAGACMVDYLPVEDLAPVLADKGLDKRPESN